MLIDNETRTISVKLVFFGPAMSGKTTAVRWLFGALGVEDRLTSIETTTGRTMFFDYGSVSIPLSKDWTVNAHIWSATGQDYYASTRETVMYGTDGIVFVADSSRDLLHSNLESWLEINKMISEANVNMPIVVCLNKQDLSDPISELELRQHLKIPESIRVFKIIAKNGMNVAEAVYTILHDAIRAALSAM